MIPYQFRFSIPYAHFCAALIAVATLACGHQETKPQELPEEAADPSAVQPIEDESPLSDLGFTGSRSQSQLSDDSKLVWASRQFGLTSEQVDQLAHTDDVVRTNRLLDFVWQAWQADELFQTHTPSQPISLLQRIQSLYRWYRLIQSASELLAPYASQWQMDGFLPVEREIINQTDQGLGHILGSILAPNTSDRPGFLQLPNIADLLNTLLAT